MTCGNNGYLHPRFCFVCVCPQGFTGPTCEDRALGDNGAPPNCGSVVQVFPADWLRHCLFVLLGDAGLANTQRRSCRGRRNLCWTARLLLLPHKGCRVCFGEWLFLRYLRIYSFSFIYLFFFEFYTHIFATKLLYFFNFVLIYFCYVKNVSLKLELAFRHSRARE